MSYFFFSPQHPGVKMARTITPFKKRGPPRGLGDKSPRYLPASRRWSIKAYPKVKRSTTRAGVAEIRAMQASTDLIIKKAPFARVVRAIAERHMPDARWQPEAFEALLVAAEKKFVCFFEDSNCAAIHAKRFTLMPGDLALVEHLAVKDTDTLHK